MAQRQPVSEFTHCCGSFEEFQRQLRDHEVETGMRYVTYRTEKEFNAPLQRPPETRTVRWFDGKAFVVVGWHTMDCDRGRDRHKHSKAQYAEKRLNMVEQCSYQSLEDDDVSVTSWANSRYVVTSGRVKQLANLASIEIQKSFLNRELGQKLKAKRQQKLLELEKETA